MPVNRKQNNHAIFFLQSKLRTTMLCLFLLLSFSVIKFVPGLKLIYLIWLGFLFLYLIVIYPAIKSSQKIPTTHLEIYSLVILCYIPITAAYMASDEFNQPFLYGYLAMAPTLQVSVVLIFLNLYGGRFFTFLDIERAILWLIWISIFIHVLIPKIFNANEFENIDGFIGGMENIGEKKFILPGQFICLGFYYYAFSSYWERNIKHGVIALLIFSFLALFGGRSGFASILGSYLFFLFRWGNSRKKIYTFLKVSVLGILLIIFFALLSSVEFSERQEKFSDAITVVIKQEQVEDISANARNMESEIALPYIEKHWFLGNGVLSNQWNDGFKTIFGHFHPSDIGLLGALYMYGLLGCLLFLVQYYFAIKYSKALPTHGEGQCRLVNAIKGYILYTAFNSLTTAVFVIFPEQNLILITVLYCASLAKYRRSGQSL